MKQHHPISLRLLCIFTIIYCCSPKLPAAGSEFTASPFINLQSEYNDNLFGDDDDKTEDVMANVSSGIDLINSTERWRSSLSAKAVVKAYSENSELNTIDKNVSGSFRGRLTERMIFLLNGGFTADSRNDRDFEETGIIDGEKTLEIKKVIRQDTVLESSVSYDLSEIAATSIKYNIRINEFDDREFADYTTHKVSFRLNRDLLEPIPNMDIFVGTDYYWYKSIDKPLLHSIYGENYKNEINLESISLIAGASADLTENLNFRIQLGGRYNESRSTSKILGVTVTKTDEDDWGHLSEIALGYNGEKNACVLSIYNDIRPRTGEGGFVKNTATRVKYSHRFTDDFRAGLLSGYYLNKSYGLFDLDKVDQQTFRIQTNVIYLLNRTLSFECQYDYSIIDDRTDRTEVVRNKVMIGISLRYPYNR